MRYRNKYAPKGPYLSYTREFGLKGENCTLSISGSGVQLTIRSNFGEESFCLTDPDQLRETISRYDVGMPARKLSLEEARNNPFWRILTRLAQGQEVLAP